MASTPPAWSRIRCHEPMVAGGSPPRGDLGRSWAILGDRKAHQALRQHGADPPRTSNKASASANFGPRQRPRPRTASSIPLTCAPTIRAFVQSGFTGVATRLIARRDLTEPSRLNPPDSLCSKSRLTAPCPDAGCVRSPITKLQKVWHRTASTPGCSRLIFLIIGVAHGSIL